MGFIAYLNAQIEHSRIKYSQTFARARINRVPDITQKHTRIVIVLKTFTQLHLPLRRSATVLFSDYKTDVGHGFQFVFIICIYSNVGRRAGYYYYY